MKWIIKVYGYTPMMTIPQDTGVWGIILVPMIAVLPKPE